jgi:hypothetical protein
MPVLPVDLHSGASRQVDFHRFGVSGGHLVKYRRKPLLVVCRWPTAPEPVADLTKIR